MQKFARPKVENMQGFCCGYGEHKTIIGPIESHKIEQIVKNFRF